jgi:hypothetical protein
VVAVVCRSWLVGSSNHWDRGPKEVGLDSTAFVITSSPALALVPCTISQPSRTWDSEEPVLQQQATFCWNRHRKSTHKNARDFD